MTPQKKEKLYESNKLRFGGSHRVSKCDVLAEESFQLSARKCQKFENLATENVSPRVNSKEISISRFT